jgi:predicted  nucleic acid-binding Zn-ribbon protein
MFCPECGKVYYTQGNKSNQLQPDWEEKSRINDIQKLIASHVKSCGLDIAPEFSNEYIEIMAKKFNINDVGKIKTYAKIGCLMKIKEIE